MWSRVDVRYGVFLLPDARTSAAVTRITTYLHAQYGFVSARRFPPHITLAGSLPLAVTEADLVAAVRDIASRHRAVPMVNSGPRQLWDSVLAFDVHGDGGGRPNPALVDLAVDVMEMARPRLGPVGDLPADVHGRDDWHGHLSLASHDLRGRRELLRRVDQFVAHLDEPFPARFVANEVGVFRFRHPSWTGDWWTDFTWELVDLVELDGSDSGG